MKIILLLILLAIVGAGSYFIGRNELNLPLVQSPTPIPDPTANWRTYTSPLGYSIKYPTELNYSTNSYQGIGGTVNTDTWSNPENTYSINVYSYKVGVNSRLEFNLQNQKTTIQIESQAVDKMTSLDGTLAHIGPIRNGGNEYLNVYTSGIKKDDQGLSLFNQMVATFKFTD